jgi:hypothetical protein
MAMVVYVVQIENDNWRCLNVFINWQPDSCLEKGQNWAPTSTIFWQAPEDERVISRAFKS